MPGSHHVLSLLTLNEISVKPSTAFFFFLNLIGNQYIVTTMLLMVDAGDTDGSGDGILIKAQQFKNISGTIRRG